MLKVIREISGEMFIFVSLINQFPNMLEKLTKQILPIMELLVFIVHDRCRVHFAQIVKGLHK